MMVWSVVKRDELASGSSSECAPTIAGLIHRAFPRMSAVSGELGRGPVQVFAPCSQMVFRYLSLMEGKGFGGMGCNSIAGSEWAAHDACAMSWDGTG
jgi:hypothetical protein